MSGFTKLLTVGGVAGVSGLGAWLLMKVIAPSREEMLKVLPEKNPQVMAESRNRSQAFLDVIKASAETDKPIFRDGIGVLLEENLKKD